jgi:hypothetical protein
MDSAHLPFSQPIPLSRPINTLLRVRNATTCVEQECFPESAEQTGLRWGSTARQQVRGSRRRFFFQVRQDLLDDLGCTWAGMVNLDFPQSMQTD